MTCARERGRAGESPFPLRPRLEDLSSRGEESRVAWIAGVQVFTSFFFLRRPHSWHFLAAMVTLSSVLVYSKSDIYDSYIASLFSLEYDRVDLNRITSVS